MMPGTPTEARLVQDTSMGRLFITTFRVYTKNGGYVVSYNDYPHFSADRAEDGRILAGVRDGSIGNINGRLVTQSIISLNGHPGLEYVAEFKLRNAADSTVKSRIYLIGNRLYQLSVIGLKGELSLAQQKKFLNSFKLLR